MKKKLAATVSNGDQKIIALKGVTRQIHDTVCAFSLFACET